MKAPRPKVPLRLRNKLFDEVRSACPNPACEVEGVSNLEIHHMDGDRQNNAEKNLIALCSTCHTRAGKHLISETDVDLWKRMLVAGFHPRLGALAPVPKRAARAGKTVTFNATGNTGTVQQAERIVNDYRGAGKKPKMEPAPDSIGAHAAERGYLEYLRKKYIECRLKEQEYGEPRSRSFDPAQATNIIKKVLGGIEWRQAPITSFDRIWREMHQLVCKTVGARKYMRGAQPKTWADYRRKLEGERPEGFA